MTPFDAFSGGVVAWDQLAFSLLFAVIFVRDIRDHREATMRVLSNVVALGGCVLLVAHALFQPPGVALMALVMVAFVGSLIMHALSGTWDRTLRPRAPPG